MSAPVIQLQQQQQRSHNAYSCAEDLISACQHLLDLKQYKKVRVTITHEHHVCQTDDVKVPLLRIWEESLYQEFIATRLASSPEPLDMNDPAVKAKVLSNSMRYKLRKKYPFPIPMDHLLKVKNARLPKPVHDGLNAWLVEHKENPYPNKVEKEALAMKLGILPQQVNRWFIQRRKMLRIRGDLYLGRSESKSKEAMIKEEDDMWYDDDDNVHESHDHAYESGAQEDGGSGRTYALLPAAARPIHILRGDNLANVSKAALDDEDEDDHGRLVISHEEGSRSILEQRLQQQFVSKTHYSGGSVENLEHMQMPIQRIAVNNFTPPTPPASVAGDRQTPEEWTPTAATGAGPESKEAPLDLSSKKLNTTPTPKSSPVILEQLSPSWRFEQEEAVDSDQLQGTSEGYNVSQAELDAANALLALRQL